MANDDSYNTNEEEMALLSKVLTKFFHRNRNSSSGTRRESSSGKHSKHGKKLKTMMMRETSIRVGAIQIRLRVLSVESPNTLLPNVTLRRTAQGKNDEG